VLKVTWNAPPASLTPESNRPSGAPGAPDVTVCGSPAKVQRTTSPSFTVRLSGSNLKFTDATVTVAASTEPMVASRKAPTVTATRAARASIGRLGRWVGRRVAGVIEGSYVAPAGPGCPALETERSPPAYRWVPEMTVPKRVEARPQREGTHMQRKRLALVVAAMALLAVPGSVSAVDPTQPAYGGPMTGAQENPAVVTTATGQGTAVISADGSTITYIVAYSGLSGPVNAAHIHTGAAGANGGVILPLVPGPSPMVGTLTAANFSASGPVTTFAEAVAAIRAGTTYFNLHTTANPGGEIRGQILAAGDAYFADLNGHQENPDVATAATGKGIAVISGDASTVTYLVTFTGLSGTVNAAHIHTGAVGANGGVILPLVPGPSPITGTLTAANFAASGPVTTFAEAIAAIRAGTTYFNLHTTANPGGEIRGQIGVTVAAPAPTPAPTPEPTEAPEPTVDVTIPPTSVTAAGTPVAPADSIGFVALVALLAAAGTLLWVGRRRSSIGG
jgi:hypothetical protein